MPKPLIYKRSKVVKLTEVQYQTLKKLEKYNVRVCNFIRDAISEKLQREKIEIVKPKRDVCPFWIIEQVNTYTQKEVHSNISKLQDEVDLLKLRRTDITKRINELKKQIDAWKELDLSQIKMF